MHTQQRDRAHSFLQSRNIHRALFANPATVAWLTGFAPPPHMGQSPFAGGPPLVWYDSGQFTLIITDLYDTSAVSIPVVRYGGFIFDRPMTGADDLLKAVRPLLGNSAQSLGVETYDVPASLASPELNVTPINGWLSPFRMVKTAEELAKMRRAYALGDLAHAAARQATVAGAREIDVWNAAHAAVQAAQGHRVPFGNDCVVNYREGNIGGPPGDLVLHAGDSVIVDISTRVEGYWSDSCGTYYVSGPSAKQKAMHNTAAKALEFAISLIKPGAIANEIDGKVRKFIANAGFPVYPHHTGHGIGASTHEEPRIVPYNTTPLEAGMVVMLEPGTYFPTEAAVRLEDAVLVTSDGAEVLTKHDKSYSH